MIEPCITSCRKNVNPVRAIPITAEITIFKGKEAMVTIENIPTK